MLENRPNIHDRIGWDEGTVVVWREKVYFGMQIRPTRFLKERLGKYRGRNDTTCGINCEYAVVAQPPSEASDWLIEPTLHGPPSSNTS